MSIKVKILRDKAIVRYNNDSERAVFKKIMADARSSPGIKINIVIKDEVY